MAIYVCAGMYAVPIEIFGISDVVGELLISKFGTGLLVLAVYLSLTVLTKDVVAFPRIIRTWTHTNVSFG